MANFWGDRWVALVALCVVAGCNPSGPPDAVSKRAEALSPGPSFTLQLPPQVTSGGSGLTASTTLTLGDRLKVKQATGSAFAGVVNLGSGLTIIGQDAKTGDVWSVGSVQLGDRSVVNGFLKTAGTLSPGVNTSITGALQQSQPLPPPTLATVTVQFQNGAPAVPIANDAAPPALSPGDYGAVSLGARAVLTLSTGDYRFDSLATQLPSTLRVTTTAGPIRIFVRNTLNWNSTVTAAAGDPTKLLVGYVGSAPITINTSFTGTLLSPNAAVTLPTGSSPHSGAFFAKALVTQPDVVVTTKPFQQPCQGVIIDDGNACTTDACDPNTGAVSHLPVSNGSACSDGNACTAVDSCQAGVCVGASPVVCTAQDQCHSVGVCAPATGLCSNPSKADGSSCSDGSACTQSDSCQAGACVGANPITCTAQDQCHSPGTCNAATGTCSNPPKADGSACADGNACTQSDTCQAGACVGASPVLCVALDQCHAAGSCNSATGACSNPVLPDGSSCSDGNACTQTDTCQAGSCTGTSLVTCSALDQCHEAGSCNPASGICSNPTKTDGSTCSDGNACTQTDTCQSGSCVGASPVVCAALDQCHVAGSCSSATGACSNPAKADGAACSDGNSCTQSDSCQTGTCVGSNPIVCVALDQCHVPGSCDASSGTCSNPGKADGTACNDANACTAGEVCSSGLCQAGSAVATDDGNPCTADACDPSGGVSHTPVNVGTACDDSDLCNGHETCNAIGFCGAGSPALVDDSNPCTADSCDASAGVVHAPIAEGTSCSDGNLCNGVEACSASGQCIAASIPTLDDGNPCTKDTCDPVQGAAHIPVAAGLSCADSNVCNGEERCDALGVCTARTPPSVDDGDPCTTDSCSALNGVSHAPVVGCVDAAGDKPFETRASFMGRVLNADGSPVTTFSAQVFNDTLDAAPRSDVSTSIDSSGAFRIRLTEFPRGVPSGTPPQHVLIRLSSVAFPPLVRSADIRPGDAITLGDLKVLQRDSQITMVGPEGGVAQDSEGKVELTIPPGALAQATPIQITPIPARDQFPTPLPENTVTMYGIELEPSGTVLGQAATLRVKNSLNLPTTLKIPVGVADTHFGDWVHQGFATWDGARFSTTIKHFSTYDCNMARLGELTQIVTPGHDRNHSKKSTCAASSVNDSTGALEQSLEVPLHSAAGHDFSLSLSFTSELSGTVAAGKAPSGLLPLQPVTQSFVAPSIRIACLPAGGGGGCGGGGGGGGGGGPPCVLQAGGLVSIQSYNLNQHFKLLNYDVDQSQTEQANAQDFAPPFYVPLPPASDGTPARSGFIPFQLTSNIAVAGSGTCVTSGGFGVSATSAGQTPMRIPVATGDSLDFPAHQLVVNRRHSPLGSGWALNEISTLYRSPDGLSAELVHGNGQQESFHPYPTLQQVIPNQGSGNSLAVDTQTGEVFWARDSGGIRRIDPVTGAETVVASGTLFGGNVPLDFKVSYVAGERRFLGATKLGVFEIANGASRKLATFSNTAATPSIAGVGKYAYFASDLQRAGNSAVDATTVSRVDLTDPARAVVDITPVSTGDLRFDPHGEVHAVDFQFLHPSGLAQAFDGGLYVSDDRRHAVYHLAPDDAGEVGPNSFVDRVLGNGSDSMLVGPGLKFPGLDASIREPGALAVAPDGTLYVKGDSLLGGLLAYDPVEKTARWVAFDSTSSAGATNGLAAFTRLSFRDGPLAPLAGEVVIVPSGGEILRLSLQLTSQYEPTRSLTFNDSGATLLDTSADTVQQFSWRVGRSEAGLVGEAWRSGEPIRTIVYKDLDRVDYIQDPVGGRITFGYDGAGHISTITDAAQRVTHFNVDGDGNLREVIYPSNEARRFDYQDYRMISATHPNNEQSIYTYRPDGTLQTATRPGGGTTTIESGYSRAPQYDSAGRVHFESLLTDDRGVQHALTLDARGAVISDKYTADAKSYDVENVYATTLGAGGSVEQANRLLRFSHTTVNGLPVSEFTTFDSLGRPSQVKTSPISNGANQRMWGPFFDGNGRISRLAWGEGGIDWTYTYDAAGHVTKVADVSNGAGTAFPETGRRTTYDGFRSLDGQPTTVTSHGIATTLGYDSFGLVNAAVDTVGRSLTTVHDATGNALEVSDGSTTAHFDYDLAGRVTSITDAENHITTIGYQTSGCACSNGNRVTSLATPDLGPNQKWAMTYDPDGDLHTATTPLNEVETYEHNAQRDLIAVIDRADRPTTFTYDQLGRRATVTDPGNRLGVFAYSSPTASSWSGPTLYAQSQTTLPAATSLTAALADGEYQVGSNGFQMGVDRSRVVLYRDATYQSSQWIAMDSLNRVETRADRAGLGLAFDSATPGPFNSPVPFVNESYSVSSPFPVIQSKSVYDTPSSFFSATLTRNPDFDLTRFPGQFLGKNSSNPVPDLIVDRDGAGRLKRVTQTIANTATLGSSFIDYKPNGRLNSVTLTTPDPILRSTGALCTIPNNCPDTLLCQSPAPQEPKRCGVYGLTNVSSSEEFTYDARGLLYTRTLNSDISPVPGTAQYNYDAVGRNILLVYPDGHQRVQIFDALGRLTSRCYQYVDGSPDHCYTATYDAVGNPKILSDPEMRQEISYDTLDRVTEVRRYVPPNATTPAYTETYAYNALGAFSIYDGAAVDDQRPRLSGGGKASAGIPASFAGQAITLDGGGRVTSFNGQTLEYYNFEHALRAITNPAANTKLSFTYDGLQRLSNIHNGPPNDAKPTSDDSYIYSDLSSSLTAVVSTPHTNNTPPMPPDRPSTQFHIGYDGVDHPLWITQSRMLAYYELDTVGNVRRLHADPQSPVHGDLGGYSYTAFGKTIAVSDPGGVRPPLDIANQPFGWQGKRLLAAGLYDSRARVWSTDLGAFLQPDEYVYLSRAGTLWSWPGQNPFRWRDPSGRGAIGRFLGTIIGGILGGDVGAVGGAAVGGGTTWELGPGVVVGVTGGALAGSAAGVAVGGYYGGNAGDVIGDALGALASSAATHVADAVDGIYRAVAKKGKRGRFKRGADDLEQLEGVLERQSSQRKDGCPDAIANTKKSEDRLRNRLNRVENQSEADEEFGDSEDEVGPGD